MKTTFVLIALLTLGRLCAADQSLAVISALRYVTTGDADPVVHYAKSTNFGSFSTNMGSFKHFFWGGPFGGGDMTVNWSLNHQSDIEVTPSNLSASGMAELSTSGSIDSNSPFGTVVWDDTNRVEVTFTCAMPCEITLSVKSTSTQALERSWDGIHCFASVSGGLPGGTNITYLCGCRPPYDWLGEVAATNSIVRTLPAGTYRFLAVMEENESADIVGDPSGQFPPSAGLGCYALMNYSFSVKYPAFSPNIVHFQAANGYAILEFFTQAGIPCHVEYADALDAESWQALPPIAGTGGTITVTNAMSTPTPRFYRVRSGD